jgi:hypothetical protein
MAAWLEANDRPALAPLEDGLKLPHQIFGLFFDLIRYRGSGGRRLALDL